MDSIKPLAKEAMHADFIAGLESWEIGSARAERVGQGEVGGYTQRVQTTWPCLGFAMKSTSLELGRPFLLLSV